MSPHALFRRFRHDEYRNRDPALALRIIGVSLNRRISPPGRRLLSVIAWSIGFSHSAKRPLDGRLPVSPAVGMVPLIPLFPH
jgi:hypothetical protein